MAGLYSHCEPHRWEARKTSLISFCSRQVSPEIYSPVTEGSIMRFHLDKMPPWIQWLQRQNAALNTMITETKRRPEYNDYRDKMPPWIQWLQRQNVALNTMIRDKMLPWIQWLQRENVALNTMITEINSQTHRPQIQYWASCISRERDRGGSRIWQWGGGGGGAPSQWFSWSHYKSLYLDFLGFWIAPPLCLFSLKPL